MEEWQLAEANVAWMRWPLDDPRMTEFVEALDRVNAEADVAAGFVWRLQTEAGDSTGIRIADDPAILFNLSVWDSMEALFDYTYRSGHVDVFRRRRAWFRKPTQESLVMWWVPRGHRPDVDEAVGRLERLWAVGSTPDAFSFREAFTADGAPLRRPAPSREGAGPRSP